MELNRKQFDILEVLASTNTAFTQRQLEESTKYSLGTINKTMKELTEAGFVKNGIITNKGIDALEPYRAKRAIFIAAGFGTRLVPITLNTPKPLVRVHGVRIIDRLIDACLVVHSAVRNGRRCVSERTLCEAKRTPRNTKISSYSFGLITTV